MNNFRDYFKTPNHVLKLINKSKNGSWKSLSELYQIHNHEVNAVAKGYQNRGLSHGKLVRLGNIGLLRAVIKWTKNNDSIFKSYSIFFIRQSMLLGIARRGCDWQGWRSELN